MPVAESSVVVVAGSEPAVVQYEEFHAYFLSFSCNIQDLLFVKIKIGCFPVIQEDRACLISPLSAHQTCPI